MQSILVTIFYLKVMKMTLWGMRRTKNVKITQIVWPQLPDADEQSIYADAMYHGSHVHLWGLDKVNVIYNFEYFSFQVCSECQMFNCSFAMAIILHCKKLGKSNLYWFLFWKFYNFQFVALIWYLVDGWLSNGRRLITDRGYKGFIGRVVWCNLKTDRW